VSLLSNTLFKISKGNKKYINLNVKWSGSSVCVVQFV
jgi:hypothetical protein